MINKVKLPLMVTLSAILISAVFSLYGCGEENQSEDASSGIPSDVAVVYANRANSKASLSSDLLLQYVQPAVENNCFVACVPADGKTEPVFENIEITEENGRRKQEAINEKISSIQQLDWTSLNQEVDIFAALSNANRILGQSDPDVQNVLVVADSGISTSGIIDFNDDATRKGLLDTTSYIQGLLDEGDLTESQFNNIDKVVWYGIGLTSEPQMEPNSGTKEAIQNLYAAVFKAGGVEDVTFEGGTSQEPYGNPPSVTVIDLPKIGMKDGRPIQLGDTLTFSSDGNDSDLQFKTGTSNFINKSKAMKTLNDSIELLKSYKDLHVTISGYTDTVGSKDANKALSKKRAQKVASLLIAKGVSKKQITTVGKGESNKYGKGDVAENRRVELKFE